MKLIWLTDIHLNFINFELREKFYQNIMGANADCILISGDIADAPTISDILVEMMEYMDKPIYSPLFWLKPSPLGESGFSRFFTIV